MKLVTQEQLVEVDETGAFRPIVAITRIQVPGNLEDAWVLTSPLMSDATTQGQVTQFLDHKTAISHAKAWVPLLLEMRDTAKASVAAWDAAASYIRDLHEPESV